MKTKTLEIGKYYKYLKYDPQNQSIIISHKYHECVGKNIIQPIYSDDNLPMFKFEIDESYIQDFEEVSKEEALNINNFTK